MGYTIWPDGITGEVVEEIYKERLRQEELRQKGKFPWTLAAKHITNAEKLCPLGEEFGEVAREVTEQLISAGKGEIHMAGQSKLREELIQLAACAAAWAESLPK